MMEAFRTNYIRQHDIQDCAAACLASVFNFYGVKIPLIRMREVLRVDKNGSNMYALCKVAKDFGFKADVLQGEWRELVKEISVQEIHLPAICHVHVEGMGHFVIIKKMTEKMVWIFDPGKGHMKCEHDIFQKLWTGFILSISPTDKIKKQNLERKSFQRYWNILIHLKWKFVGILLLSFLIAGSSVAYAYAYQKIIDRFVFQNVNSSVDTMPRFSGIELLAKQVGEMFNHIPYLFGAMVLIVFIQFVLGLIRGSLLAYVEKAMDMELSKQYIFKLLSLTFKYFQQCKSGELLRRYQDINFIRNAISGSVLTITFETVMAIAGFIILVRINTTLFLIVLSMIVLYLMIVYLHRRPMRYMSRKIMEEDAKVTSSIKEGIDGIAAIKLFSREEYYGEKVVHQMKDFAASCYKGDILNVLQSELLAVIQGAGVIFVLWKGTIYVMQGDMTLGTLFLFVSLMGYFITPVKSLIGLQAQLQEAWIAADRLNDVLEAKTEKAIHAGSINSVSLNGEIRYQNVFFRYGYRKWIIQNVTLSIKEGEHIALTGANGSGKSTLVRLLVGMYEPEYGNITVGNYDVKDLKLECIRNHIAYVPQEPVILSGTIRDELLFGSQIKINDSKFEEIMNGCYLNEMVNNNPFGYEWILTENGTNISGGHRQRIAIARALLTEPDILILDEATSQIDKTREKDIIDFIFRYRTGKTVIVISHDEKIIEKCDREICIG